MDSRRHFLRGLARAAADAARPPAPTEAPAGGRTSAAPPAEEATGPTTTPAPEAGPAPDADPAARYATALADPTWGGAAQSALERSEVLIIGAGALGTPVLGYLAGAGVGRLGVLDHADVALADLHAETVHFTPDVGVPKAHSAAAKLGFLNPEIVIEPYQVRLEETNVEGLLAGQHLVVDCSNDEGTQVIVARAAARLGLPLVSAGVWGHGGWVVFVPAGEHACPVCAADGQGGAGAALAGPVAGAVGALQAREALQRLADGDATPAGTVLRLDLRAPELRRDAPVRRADCPDCGDR